MFISQIKKKFPLFEERVKTKLLQLNWNILQILNITLHTMNIVALHIINEITSD